MELTASSVNLHVMVSTSPNWPTICTEEQALLGFAKSHTAGGTGSTTGGIVTSMEQSPPIQPSSQVHTPGTKLKY